MRSLGLLLVATLATATVFAQDAAPQALESGVAVSGTIGPDPDELRPQRGKIRPLPRPAQLPVAGA